MNTTKLIACLVIALSCLYECSALECYVCSNQTDNSHKCLNTIKTCEPGEDVCLTDIRWGSTPYFSMGAQKQFYVSKSCAQKKICHKKRNIYMKFCTHIWYEDWQCSECCLGDRCNYFVISGADSVMKTASLMTVFSLLGLLYFKAI